MKGISPQMYQIKMTIFVDNVTSYILSFIHTYPMQP